MVYVRNPDYVPRKENPSGAAGGKRALVDRVEWRYIPDAATAGAALEAGEVDYWENVPLDFAPRLEKNANLSVFVTDPKGSQGILRPNHLHPPFNNKKARQALLLAVDQKNYLQAVIGHEKYYKTCPSVFMCGGLPYETSAGSPKPDLERARALLQGVRLRRAAHRGAGSGRLALRARAGPGDDGSAEVARRQRGPAIDGLVHDGCAPG